MKKKLLTQPRPSAIRTDELLDELQLTEKEFGELLSNQWEAVVTNPQLQKKALSGAKRIKELRLMLINQRLVHRTIQ